MLKNILYFIGSILLFFAGIILYGIILNIREDSLQQCLENKNISEPTDISIIIDRHNYKLNLYSGRELIKSYKAVFGKNDSQVKKSKNDFVTPIGKYAICIIDTSKEYYKIFKINYPNEANAAESLKNGYITTKEFRNIVSEIQKGNCPPANTVLGSNISIHGIGKFNFIFKNLPFVFNWTNGSIAVSDESMDELSTVITVGTKVEIKN